MASDDDTSGEVPGAQRELSPEERAALASNKTMQLDAMSDELFEEIAGELDDAGADAIDDDAPTQTDDAPPASMPPPLPPPLPRRRRFGPLAIVALVGVMVVGIGLALLASHFLFPSQPAARAQAAPPVHAPPKAAGPAHPAAPAAAAPSGGTRLELPAVVIKSSHGQGGGAAAAPSPASGQH